MAVSPELQDLTRRIQSALGFEGADLDGVWGMQTAGAVAQMLNGKMPKSAPADQRSEGNISTLLPPVRTLARKLIKTFNAQNRPNIAKVISGTRTYAEQNALYAQGRTKPGRKVTNAKAGYSWHNHGNAFDIGIFDELGNYLEESPLYRKAGALGKSLGMEWGGDWKSFTDEPHFQFNPRGLTLAEARAAHNNGDSIV